MKNMAKKIVAIGTGALMLGATLTGALAANDLANYPAPFVKDGALDNTVIVVGKNAETADVLGAIDIAAALQAKAVTPVKLSTSTTVAPEVDKGVKIEKSGDKFNYGENATGVVPEGLNEVDLPEILGKGTFRDTKGDNKATRDFRQSLKFGSGSVFFNLYQPDDSDNYPEGRPAGNYVYLPDGQRVYNYTLTFTSAVKYDTDGISTDLEGNTLNLQGNTYTITEATGDSAGKLTKLKLVAGDSTVWLVQDQPYTLGSHTVTVVDVDQGETRCGINVDGTTVWVDVGTTQVFGELSVGVLQAVAVHTKDYDADTCEVTLGSNEIVLEDGEVVKVNDDELDGSLVTFHGTAGSWEGFSVTYDVGYADEGINQGDVYLKEGEAWTDPVFGNFKIMYGGTTATTEEMKLERTASDKAKFTFTNYGGQKVEIYWYESGNSLYLGEDSSKRMLYQTGQIKTGDPERTRFLYTTSGGEAHVLELSRVYGLTGTNANTTDIKDLTYGVTVADKRPFTPGTPTSIPLSGLGSITLNISAGSSGWVQWVSGGNSTVPKTKLGGKLTFTNDTVVLDEEDEVEVTPTTVTMTLSYDASSDERIELDVTEGTLLKVVNKDQEDSDNKVGVTQKGTWVEWNEDSQNKVTVMYPEKDVYANVFIAPLEASVVGGSTGGATADKVNPFQVGLAVLDEDAEKMTKNMIVVGGPCVNTVAAALMGNPTNCAEGFEKGKAKIKFFEWKGKAALLVAGYEAKDTMGAAYALVQKDKFKLSGDEVELVVTSLDQIKVV